MNRNSRYFFIDILKVIALFMMPIIHINSVFDGVAAMGLIKFTADRASIDLLCSVLYLFTPGIFMLCMGFVLSNSSRNTPEKLAKRGLQLLLIGLILNVFRGTLIYTIGGFLFKDNSMFLEAVVWLFGSDILYFVGLYLLLYAFLKKIGASDVVILVVAAALQIIGTLLPRADTGNAILNAIIGNFVLADKKSFFPLVWWVIYPVAGLFLRKGYDAAEKKSGFMLKCAAICAAVFAVTSAALVLFGRSVSEYLLWGQHALTMRTPSMLLTLSFEGIYISLIYFVSELLRSPRLRNAVSAVAEKLNLIYCIHWLLLMDGITVFSLFVSFFVSSLWQVIVGGLIIAVLSIAVAFLIEYIKKKKEPVC